jgi:signal transduction histidine kinase
VDATLVEVLEHGGGERGTAARAVLPGLARWGAAAAVAAAGGAVLVRGVRPVPSGAVEVTATEDLVVVLADAVAVVAVADGPSVRWSCSPSAVRAVVELLELPRSAVDRVARAVARTSDEAPPGGVPLMRALDAVVAADRQELAGRLHDGPVQELTAAQLLLDSALWGVDLPAGARDPLEQGLGALRAAIAGCRTLMADLREGGGQRA